MSRTHQVPASSTIGEAAPEISRQLRAELDANPEGKIIFEGSITTREQASATLTAREAAGHGTSYFDLIEVLNDKLTQPMLRARVLSSMAWMLDMNVINTGRSLFYDVHKEATESGTIDNFADFLSKMCELQAGEAFAEGLGYELNTGRLASLSLMLRLRQTWHDKAESAAANARIKYEPKSFEVLMASEKVQTVDTLTREKLSALVDATYEGENASTEEIAQAQALLLNQQAARNVQIHESRQLVAPAILRIIDNADFHGKAIESAEFWQLALDTQIRLIGAARRAVERTLSDLASYKTITTLEYVGMIKECKAMTRELDAVLTTGKYATH
jgi:hypothetical protein